jgi:uncharacterized protein YjiS (DUF1127 family)
MSGHTQFVSGVVGRAPTRHRPGSGAIDWIRLMARRWRERRTLEGLDDRMLRDIGINRLDAMAEARKPFWVE